MAQRVQTFTDKDSLEVGDRFRYILIVDKTAETVSETYPAEEQIESDDLTWLSRDIYRTSATRDSLVYELQFFGIEDTVIPPKDIQLTYGDGSTTTLTTSEIPLLFRAVVQQGDEEFRPLKPIFDFGRRLWPYILALLIVLLAGWYLYKRLAGRTPTLPQEPLPPIEPFSNPIERLKHDLDRLSGTGSPLIRRDYKAFYIALGDSIRRYFEDVYDIRALEMTSREILSELRQFPADKQVIEITRNVLNEADVVKFARYNPDMDQAKHALSIAYRFADIVEDSDRVHIEQLRSLYEEKEIEKRERMKAASGPDRQYSPRQTDKRWQE